MRQLFFSLLNMYHLIETFWMGNIPANQLCQLRNTMKKFFASNTLACLTVIYTQTIV